MTGHTLIKALENGIGAWPQCEGRFPVTSGIKFQFDPTKPQGSRIILNSIKDDTDQAIDLNKRYSVAVGSNLLLGKDGYEVL